MNERISIQRRRTSRGYAPGWLVVTDFATVEVNTYAGAVAFVQRLDIVKAEDRGMWPITIEASGQDLEIILKLALQQCQEADQRSAAAAAVGDPTAQELRHRAERYWRAYDRVAEVVTTARLAQ